MGRLIVVSNRIPTDALPQGGLVVALHEALLDRGGVWIGSSGDPVEGRKDELKTLATDPYTRMSFDLSPEEYDGFYLGYANSMLWPLFHHRVDLVEVNGDHAEMYRAVNDRVAGLIARQIQPGDMIWVHDYHFLPLAAALRRRGVTARIGFFLHIPFPNSSDMFALPERKQMPQWLAAYDIVGLQTRRDVANCLEYLRKDTGAEMTLKGRLRLGERFFEVRSFPIGIDVEGFAKTARETPAPALNLAPEERLVLGVDRLDYSKGLVHRFEGFGRYLEMRAEEIRDRKAGEAESPRPTLLQIAPPSREDVEAYRDIRESLETAAGRINGAHAELDWTPIRYIRRGLPRELLAGLYARADLMLVTPLADGMNLVAKEFVAAQDPDDPGVLVLSHFAGAAEQMDEALMVNPYDQTDMARAIGRGLTMPLDERKDRYRALYDRLLDYDIDWWTESFLRVLSGEDTTTAAA